PLPFEHQLDAVGERLKHALGPDEVRAHPLLQNRRHLALGVDHDGRRAQQHDEDEERQDDLRDEERTHGCVATPWRARQSAGSVQWPSLTCASYSCRKCFSVVNTGVTAASPNAQSVLPAMLLATLVSRSRSLICPAPRSILRRILYSQSVPSRQGVHLPHDSWR